MFTIQQSASVTVLPTINGCSSNSRIFFSFSIWSTCLLSMISFFFIALIANFTSELSFSHANFTFPKAPKILNRNRYHQTILTEHMNETVSFYEKYRFLAGVETNMGGLILTFAKTCCPNKIGGAIVV